MTQERQRWEYEVAIDTWDVTSIEAAKTNRQQAAAGLNKTGGLDWELVAVETVAEHDGKAVLVYFFKRPAQ